MLEQLCQSFHQNKNNNAFCIEDKFYTYSEFGRIVSGIQEKLSKPNFQNIGIVTYNDLETYASIIAVFLSGKTFIPINPLHPLERNLQILSLVKTDAILSSVESNVLNDFENKTNRIIYTSGLAVSDRELRYEKLSPNQNAYILFTSGSTGIPKAVPITYHNLFSFINSLQDIQLDLNNNDKFLQMFDLTFDLSVFSYLIPMFYGACIYTLPNDKIKYLSLYSVMSKHNITVSLMTPSVLSFLKNYFDEIRFEKLRYSLFCGEPLTSDICEKWAKCVPNAKIFNVYGPTEATIFCSFYYYNPKHVLEYNGILSIGKPLKGTDFLIVDQDQNVVTDQKQGELCISGDQVTAGYLNDSEKNKEVFFFQKYNGQKKRFYKTGDICFADKDGNLFFVGRKDNQIKVQGYRVELGEIEYFARKFCNEEHVAAIATTNRENNTEIVLFVRNLNENDMQALNNYFNKHLPFYMIPSRIISLPEFPMNTNGKTDRSQLKKLISQL